MKELKPFVVDLPEVNGFKPFPTLLRSGENCVRMRSGYTVLAPGASVGEHVTSSREEVIIILEGSAEVLHGEAGSIRAEAESVVYMPPETRHDVKNAGEGPLRYVYVVAML